MIAMLSIGATAVAEPLSMGAPFGAAWGGTYGFPPLLAVPFVDQARALGAGFTRVTLYWSQLEPRPGTRRWTDLDAYVAQLRSPEEGIVTLASASPWATRTSTYVFPSSPANDPDAYYAFVRASVAHVKGRVRYFQNDPEPNNPFFWRGTVDDFIAQQKLFYRAVKDADPDAVVVLAGCDGLFDPTERSQRPPEVASLAFFSRLIADAAREYDVFDLRLYGDPYTIPARVAWVRERIARAGGTQPVIATEYAGPTFFELPANRRWFVRLQGPDASATVREMRMTSSTLPVDTQLFVDDAPATASRRLTLQARDLVVRNLIAFASGVRKTAFWDLWHDASDPTSANTMMYGTLRLLSVVDQQRAGPTTLGDAFARLTSALGDATAVERITVDDAAVYAFLVTRARGTPVIVAWRRAPEATGDAVAASVRFSWPHPLVRASTLAGENVPTRSSRDAIELALGSEPIFIEMPPTPERS